MSSHTRCSASSSSAFGFLPRAASNVWTASLFTSAPTTIVFCYVVLARERVVDREQQPAEDEEMQQRLAQPARQLEPTTPRRRDGFGLVGVLASGASMSVWSCSCELEETRNGAARFSRATPPVFEHSVSGGSSTAPPPQASSR